MKSFLKLINLIIITAMLVSCATPSGTNITPTVGLPTAEIRVTSAPDPQSAITGFLEAWKIDDFTGMYAYLSAASKAFITAEDFVKFHNDSMNAMGLRELEYSPIATNIKNPASAEAYYSLTYHTSIIGDIQRDFYVILVNEQGQWRVEWEYGLVLPELAGGGKILKMDYRSPVRGNIYDRAGNAITTQTEVVALGIIPGEIDPNNEYTLLNHLNILTGIPIETIQNSYASAGADWYIPVGETTAEKIDRNIEFYSGLAGLRMNRYTSRYYPNGGLAPQAVGYAISIPEAELTDYRRLGYSGNERVGDYGIERAAEQYLAGKRGGTLYVVDSNGAISSRIGQSDTETADNVFLTIDPKLQAEAQLALRGFRGAVVVLERDTGRVLAMASSPGFDPNIFDPDNPNHQLLGDAVFNANTPLYNRATQGAYPLGSVFKIITFAAGLESGLFKPEDTYDCQYEFTDLVPYGGPVLVDWTYQHYLKDVAAGDENPTLPSGLLTYPEALMRSCNPWFYHIGLTLFEQGHGSDITNMATAFGLGKETGIEIEELAGIIPQPQTPIEATNQAIGQGEMKISPLQVARFVAAVGNGGTLYRPQLIEQVQDANGNPILVFSPKVDGTLPIKASTLKELQAAMLSVIENPRGTAYHRFVGMQTPMYGKTGTAESGDPERPYAWFAGYTDTNDPAGKPDIAIAVIVENIGEGSEYGAPIFRRMIEVYFTGAARVLFPWEVSFYVTKTPTPLGGRPTRTARPTRTPRP